MWRVLKEKLANSQKACLQWRKRNEDPTASMISRKTTELRVLQEECEESDLDQIMNLRMEINELIELEELKWRQQAKH